MKMKNFVVILFMVMLSTTILTSSLMSRAYYYEEKLLQSGMPVQLSPTYDESTNGGKLRAMLKGSIYESGEQMTVFGACMDGYGYLIANDNTLNATLSSWYPNGTIWELDKQMTVVVDPLTGNQSGRWEYQVNMGTVPGTYLTEITCRYQGDIANAFGEWQNPNWVARIKQIQDSNSEYYTNLTSQITTFSNTVQSNFSTVLDSLANISAMVGNGTGGAVDLTALDPKLAGIYNGLKGIDPVYWTIDSTWPIIYGGNASFAGWKVDLLSANDIYVIGNQPYTWNGGTDNVYYYDGYTWSPLALPTTTATPQGVSVLAAAAPYAWIFTDEGISINGGAYLTTGIGAENFTTGKVFQRNPGETIFAYAIENNGILGFSSDGGTSWGSVANWWPSDIPGPYASISNILWYDDGNSNNYRMMATADVIDDPAVYYNGTDYVATGLPPSGFKLGKVVLLRDDLGYVLADDGAGQSVVLQFNGTGFMEVFRSNSSLLTGITALNENDIWVTGDSPVGFYHYNGINWQHSSYPYSAGIIIGFDQNLTLANMKDLQMIDLKTGYAISDNGVLLRLTSHYDTRVDEIMAKLNNQTALYAYLSSINMTLNDVKALGIEINSSVQTVINNLAAMNVTITDTYSLVNSINTSVSDLTNVVLAMNTSIMLDLSEIKLMIADMNASLSLQLTQILANQTYMQLYLETTMYPMLNATYQNTLSILSSLGIIQTQLNETMLIANQTLNVTLDTQAGVNELVNKSRRIRAWITV